MGLLSKFKIRRSDKPAPRGAASDPAEQVREVRIKARRRLIGVTLLLVIGIIGFPLLFETQPRPIPVDIPIEIPARDGAAPLHVAAPDASSPRVAVVAPPPVEPTGSDAGADEVIEPTVSASTAAAAAAPAPAPEVKKPEVRKPEPKPAEPVRETKSDSRSSDKASDVRKDGGKATSPEAVKPKDSKTADSKTADAKAGKSAAASKPADAKPVTKPAEAKSTEAKAADSKSDEGRFVVQIGAFAEANSARDARGKVELLGLSTYTQVIESSTGRRIRVRVGPFTTKADADKAAAKIKAAGLQAAVLKL
jgi:DedD protein